MSSHASRQVIDGVFQPAGLHEIDIYGRPV